MTKDDRRVRRAAAREIFFGEQFRNQTAGGGRGLDDDDDAVSNNQLSRFVESFTTADGELWLVFVDEGRSVHEVREEEIGGKAEVGEVG